MRGLLFIIYGEKPMKKNFVTYSKDEKNIVNEGIISIYNVLFGEDVEKKRRLLFCLDWYMDPYYGQDISDIKTELINLLQTVIIVPNDIDVKEDALQLLGDYAWGPFEILEEHFENIENDLRPDAEYVINMHRIAKIEQILLDKSKEIYFDEKSKFEGISNKVWILYNKNLSEKDSKTDDIEASWLLNDGIINNEAYYRGNTFSLLNDERFYINPEIHFNILLKERKIFLAYYFGKRFARCIEYGLICNDDEYSIENPKVIWVS